MMQILSGSCIEVITIIPRYVNAGVRRSYNFLMCVPRLTVLVVKLIKLIIINCEIIAKPAHY